VIASDPNLQAEARSAKLREAEQMIQTAYERATTEKIKREMLSRLIRLYEIWARPDEAAGWQQKLNALDQAESAKHSAF